MDDSLRRAGRASTGQMSRDLSNAHSKSNQATELAAFPLFAGSSPQTIELLQMAAQLRSLAPGDCVLNEQAPANEVFALVKGNVRVFYTAESGEQILVKLFSAPAFFGEMENLENVSFLETVSAITRIKVYAIPRRVFIQCLERDHQLALRLL